MLDRKILDKIIPSLAAVGLLDASYLFYEHIHQGRILFCVDPNGCNQVLQSQYAEISSVPVALLGMVFYFSILFLSLFLIKKRESLSRKLLAALGLVGFGTSVCLVYLMLGVIKALCGFCLLSALLSTLIFVFSTINLRLKKQEKLDF